MVLISSFLEQMILRLVEIQIFEIEFNDINYLIIEREVLTENQNLRPCHLTAQWRSQ